MSSAQPATTFERRHIGPSPSDIKEMLQVVGAQSLEDLMSQTLPASIRQKEPLNTGAAMSETEALDFLRGIAGKTAKK